LLFGEREETSKLQSSSCCWLREGRRTLHTIDYWPYTNLTKWRDLSETRM